MKWIAQLLANPVRFAVDPAHGDADHFTTSQALACSFITEEECEKWIERHGYGLWRPHKIST